LRKPKHSQNPIFRVSASFEIRRFSALSWSLLLVHYGSFSLSSKLVFNAVDFIKQNQTLRRTQEENQNNQRNAMIRTDKEQHRTQGLNRQN